MRMFLSQICRLGEFNFPRYRLRQARSRLTIVGVDLDGLTMNFLASTPATTLSS